MLPVRGAGDFVVVRDMMQDVMERRDQTLID